jgi:RNA polymerase sigma factor (sigma-70 family)
MKTSNSVAVASGVGVADTGRVSDTLETLARRYHTELLRVLTARLRSEQDAADLAQEAYVRLLRYQGKCSGDDLRRMLFRIAHNLLTDHWRWRRLRGVDTLVSLDELLEVDSGQPGLDRQLAGEQQLARLEELILKMPGKRRTVFVLSRIHGLTNVEIAARCGISAKTVEKHIAIALAECRAEVGDDDLQTL